MKKLLIISFLLIVSCFGFGQTVDSPVFVCGTPDLDKSEVKPDTMPFFQANNQNESIINLKDYFSKKIGNDYITFSGKVYGYFIINEFGKIEDSKVIKSTNKSLNKLALKYIEEMPDWNPGIKDNKKVKTKYVLPITFNQP